MLLLHNLNKMYQYLKKNRSSKYALWPVLINYKFKFINKKYYILIKNKIKSKFV